VTTADGGFTASVPVSVKPLPPKLYSIGVKVSGLTSGKLVIMNNGTDRMVVTGNGSFNFANKTANYSVTIEDQPVGFQYCQASNPSGTASADTSIAVSCAPGNAKVVVFAGSGNAGARDGTGADASFSFVWPAIKPGGTSAAGATIGMTVDTNGNLYLSDSSGTVSAPNANCVIRKISPSGVVTTLAGSGQTASNDGVGRSASFANPGGIVFDPTSGNLYVAETSFGNKLRMVTPAGVVSTVVSGYVGGSGATMDDNGNIYLASQPYHIKKVTKGGAVTMVVDRLDPVPVDIAFDSAGGVFYIAAMRNSGRPSAVYSMTRAGVVQTLKGTDAFDMVSSVAVDSAGNLYVTEFGNGNIDMITPAGVITKIASTLPAYPMKIVVDGGGTLYVATNDNRIVKILPGS
jgi:sugar lactone lactonase YvrE